MNQKRSIRNIFSGVFGQLVTIAFGIYVPRLVILSLGSESNGFLNSITSVIGYLNLLEAGIGMAALQAIYDPIARGSTDRANGILSATKHFYKKTALYYAIGILGVAAIYPCVVRSKIPLYTIIIVIILSGMPNVINFYFQGKYKVLLQADGRTYVLTNMQTVTSIITSLSKVLLLNGGYGLIALQLLYFCVSLLQMLYIEWYIHKHYTWIDLSVKPNKIALNQSSSVLVHQISGLVFSTTDIVILTILCGLNSVSIYSTYVLLLGMVSTLVQNVNSGVVYIMGQTFQTNRDLYIKMHDTYEVYNMALTFSLYAIASIFIVPFVKLYTSGAEISYVDNILPSLLIATHLLENGRTASMKVISYAGHFKQTRWHALVEMALNISISVLFVFLFGMYGVILGTVFALLFRSNIMIFYASKRILNRSVVSAYKHWIINIVIYLAIKILSKLIFANIVLDTYFKIVFLSILSGIVIVPTFLVLNSILNRDIWSFVKPRLFSIVKKKLHIRGG